MALQFSMFLFYGILIFFFFFPNHFSGEIILNIIILCCCVLAPKQLDLSHHKYLYRGLCTCVNIMRIITSGCWFTKQTVDKNINSIEIKVICYQETQTKTNYVSFITFSPFFLLYFD